MKTDESDRAGSATNMVDQQLRIFHRTVTWQDDIVEKQQ
jgi:hypothetical protein